MAPAAHQYTRERLCPLALPTAMRASLLVFAVFAVADYAAGDWLGGKQLTPSEALLLSLTAIHGRVFFAQFGLDSVQSWVAAVETVTSIFIEGTFVAMLMQRLFGR